MAAKKVIKTSNKAMSTLPEEKLPPQPKTGTAMQILAEHQKPKLATVEQLESGLRVLWQGFANTLTNIQPEQIPGALQFVKFTTKLAKDAEEILKPMVIKMVKAQGAKVTDAGTMRLVKGGLQLEIQPNGTGGYIGDKLEGLIRAKGIDINTAMDQEISYKVNEGKLATLVQLKVVTQAELDTCKREESWKMMSPKKEE